MNVPGLLRDWRGPLTRFLALAVCAAGLPAPVAANELRSRALIDTGWTFHYDDPPGAAKVAHWYGLATIDVRGALAGATMVALGDSIIDGRGSTTDTDDRWTDRLVARLAH